MRIDSYLDVLCPWCFIGQRRLMTALAGLPESARVELRWRSFELDPRRSRIPGRSAAAEMADPDWWGSDAPARIAHIQALGAAEGLELNLHLARPVNTFDAHRLIQLATARGHANELVASLLHAYHTEGRDVADPRVLESIGTAAGLPRAEVRAVLAGDAYGDAVRADEHHAAERGVTGVPTLVIDGGPPIPGIQPAATLLALLRDALTRTARSPTTHP
jgi:predicted DsbA family dithiol-disulfide isomerase